MRWWRACGVHGVLTLTLTLTPAHLDGERNVRLRIAARAFEGIGNLHVVQRFGQGGGLFGGGGCGRGLHLDSEARSVSQAVYCIGTAGCRLWSRGGECATTVVVLFLGPDSQRGRCSYIPMHPILQQASRAVGTNLFRAIMPQGTTSAARIISDNLDYRERGGLRLADALRIHAALHDPNAPSVTISTGHVLPIDSGGETGVRRCHVVVDAERPRGRWVTWSNALSWQPPGSRRLRPCARGGL